MRAPISQCSLSIAAIAAGSHEQHAATHGGLAAGRDTRGWGLLSPIPFILAPLGTRLDLNLHTGALRTYWSGNHTPTLAFGAPLLVLDMYEHAYQMDYGAAAAKYIDAFMRNVDWQEVNRRFERTAKLGSLFTPPAK